MGKQFTATAYAYPWDLVGDPRAAERIRELGVDTVTMAAAYHSVRAATPRHPEHRIVDAATAASYLPVRDTAWRGQRLSPRGAEEWAGPDSFARARDLLAGAGLATTAWIVATHNSRLGDVAPDLSVRNAFGDRYRYALCPASDEVRRYVTTLAGEVAALAGADSLVVEACGPLGLGHQSQHEKTAGAGWTHTDEVLLSLCFCPSCCAAYRTREIDPNALALDVRRLVGSGVRSMVEALGDLEPVVRTLRVERSVGLRDDVVAAAEANGVQRVSFHATVDAWATGPAAAIVDRSGGVESYVVDCWAGQTQGVDNIRRTVDATSAPTIVGAYCTLLAPDAAGPGLADDWDAFLRAGASQLHLYHAGLASTHRLTAAAEALGTTRARHPREAQRQSLPAGLDNEERHQ